MTYRMALPLLATVALTAPTAQAAAEGMTDHGFYPAGLGVCYYGDTRPDDYFGLSIGCPLEPMPGDRYNGGVPTPPDPAISGPPTLVLASTSFSMPGVGFEVQATCTAKANQPSAQVTVIEACYTTNGVTAPSRSTAGYATTTAATGLADIEDWSTCASAYSVDADSVKSPTKTVCVPHDSLTGTASAVR